jgi:hypothetical protein
MHAQKHRLSLFNALGSRRRIEHWLQMVKLSFATLASFAFQD